MNSSNHRHPTDPSHLWRTAGAACYLVVLLAGCSHDSTAERVEAIAPRLSDGDVARVGDAAISGRAFAQEWNRRTDVRSKEELLQEMIRFESLLAQARAAGVTRDPEIVAAYNRMVVGKFQEDQLQRRGLGLIQVNEAEVQEYYQSHPDRYTTPAQLRLAIIIREASTKATPERREQLRQEAEDLWNQARQATNDGFRRLAAQHSDDRATRYAGGDTGWFVPGQTGARWEPKVIKAALALSRPGDLAPMVATANGFCIVKLLGTRAASVRPLSEVRDGIEYQLRSEKAQQLREKFFEEMQAGLQIEINRMALEAIPGRSMQTATSQLPSLPK